uniref:Uncharacterized protein n=1 Tax=Alexandrium monilatum TaxID=311494 RepID=A0A7S4UXK6_9DINO
MAERVGRPAATSRGRAKGTCHDRKPSWVARVRAASASAVPRLVHRVCGSKGRSENGDSGFDPDEHYLVYESWGRLPKGLELGFLPQGRLELASFAVPTIVVGALAANSIFAILGSTLPGGPTALICGLAAVVLAAAWPLPRDQAPAPVAAKAGQAPLAPSPVEAPAPVAAEAGQAPVAPSPVEDDSSQPASRPSPLQGWDLVFESTDPPPRAGPEEWLPSVLRRRPRVRSRPPPPSRGKNSG